MDAFRQKLDDDFDLDALMVRVREAALGPGAGGAATPSPLVAGDTPCQDDALVKVLDAQGEWNEHTRKALADLVQCLQTLRDDLSEAQKGLRREVGQLSTLVRRQRAPRLPIATRQAARVRHASKGGKQR